MNITPLPPSHPAGGMTLVEVTIAIAVVALGSLTALSCLVTTSQADVAIEERSVALRAAASAMERVFAFDYEGDIQLLVDHYQDPQNADFIVEDLRPAGAPVNGGEASAQGTVTLDDTDPRRIRVTVAVRWQGRRGLRSLSLESTVTEVVR